MQDFFGSTLMMGDTVAFYAPGYRMFTTGIIVGFTPKQVRVSYMNTWNHPSKGMEKTYLAYPGMFIKRPE